MAKKQKSKSTNKSFDASPDKHCSDSSVPALIGVELDLKPFPSNTSSNSSSPGQELNDIDQSEAFLHTSDAEKVGIRDGEPALLICYEPMLHPSLGAEVDDLSAAVCKIKISGDGYPTTNSKHSHRGGTPSNPKKRNFFGMTASSGVARVSLQLIHRLLSLDGRNYDRKSNSSESTENATISKDTSSITPLKSRAISTNAPSATAASLVSPLNPKFSFTKGGGRDSMKSPPKTYASPSASKFSFAKGGGGDSLISPPSTKVSSATEIDSGRDKKSSMKGVFIPLANLDRRHQIRLCSDARKLVLCPINRISKVDIDINAAERTVSSQQIESDLSRSGHVLQSLITSKYSGAYVQSTSRFSIEPVIFEDLLETVSISFRGRMEFFYVVDVSSFDKANGSVDNVGNGLSYDDESYIAKYIDGMSISSNNDCSATRGELKVENFLKRLNLSYEGNGSRVNNAYIALKVTDRTRIQFILSPSEFPQENTPEKLSDNVDPTARLCAGLDATLSKIKEALLPPLMNPNLFPFDGPLRPPKGALLYGPSGVGKSLVAAHLANELRLSSAIDVRCVQCADIMSSTVVVGEAEKKLTRVFQAAEQNLAKTKGSLVILDDVHLICPRRGGVGGGSSKEMDQLAGTLLALIDGIGTIQVNKQQGKNQTSAKIGNFLQGTLTILAITADPSILDPALRRPGRLDVEIEIPVPDDCRRAEILRFHLSKLIPLQHLNGEILVNQIAFNHPKMSPANQFCDEQVQALARLAKGFTGADCKLAVKEATRQALSRSSKYSKVSKNACSVVNYPDLEHAIRTTRPSAIKSVAIEVPRVPWSAIGGMDNVKSLLKESIELPLTHPQLFKMMQVSPPKGILLYGPPGCSKTLMARAIATEGNMNFLTVKGPELLSKWLGESERALASLFRRARLASPSVIFFDEIDAIGSKRGVGGGGSGSDRLLSQLLTELDGVTSGGASGKNKGRVVVVGATNRPDVLDLALIRPGRMDRMIYVGLPDKEGRKSIFEIALRGKACHDDVDLSVLASDAISSNYSGAEICAVCRDAALQAIGEMDDNNLKDPQICMKNLLQSMKDMKPRTTPEMLQFYDRFRKKV